MLAVVFRVVYDIRSAQIHRLMKVPLSYQYSFVDRLHLDDLHSGAVNEYGVACRNQTPIEAVFVRFQATTRAGYAA